MNIKKGLLALVLGLLASSLAFSQELIEKKLSGNWTGTYNNSSITANFTKNKILIRVDGRPKSGTYTLENNHRVILFELANAIIDGTSINLSGMEVSDKNKYLSLTLESEGLCINGEIFAGKSVISFSDISGLWTSASGDKLDIKADGFFKLTDSANDVFYGHCSVQQCYTITISNDENYSETYELVTGNDFIILSEILLEREQ